MSDTDIAAEILRLSFPDECEAIGPTVVDSIVQGRRVTPPDVGRRMDLGNLIDLITAALSFIAALLPIWFQLEAKLKRKPTGEEFQAEVASKPPPAGSLTQEQQDQIIKAVTRQRGSTLGG